ncbi:VanZ family protein [Agromyces protaetiae]|uniref:VanZ family protein n=1 Tax=Agromyces protaetiae TaxID=2509455 RepID=A0A4P6FBM1_9MICO|nr:VanZ family protein [Agromyces protaetiae]QAY73026.1 VanZ family protein [Agromyces protaetiae]
MDAGIMLRRIPLLVAAAGYLALVAWATLGPVSWHAIGWEARYGVLTPSIWFDRSTWTTGSPTEFALNIAMFLPLGALFALLAGRRRIVAAFAAAVAVSIAIEVAQIPMEDRISDPRDLLANAAGAAIGIVGVTIVWAIGAIARRLSRAPFASEFDRVLRADAATTAEPALSRTVH